MGNCMNSGNIVPAEKNRVLLQHANILNVAKEDLTRDQWRLFFMCILHVKYKDWPEDGLFFFTRQEWAKYFKVSEDEAGKDLKKAIGGFRGKVVTLYETRGGHEFTVEYDWTSSRWQNKQRGIFGIQINYALRKYMMPLAYELSYTLTDFGYMGVLEGRWALRLYRDLCQFRTTGMRVISLEQLRERWCTPPSYDRWSLLKARVLDPAIEEVRKIPMFSTLTMTVKENSSGKPERIMFNFEPLRIEHID